jgi:hypothetical protein
MRHLLSAARPQLRIALFAGLASSCAPAELCETAVPLVDATQWQLLDPADARQPEAAPNGALLCASANIKTSVFGNTEGVEVDTGPTCGFATLSRSSSGLITAGETVLIRMFHYTQTTFPAAEAHVTVSIDGVSLLDERVPIPSESGLLPRQPRIVVDRDVAAGAPVLFHVGNHGDNSWSLVELSVLRQEPCR